MSPQTKGEVTTEPRTVERITNTPALDGSVKFDAFSSQLLKGLSTSGPGAVPTIIAGTDYASISKKVSDLTADGQVIDLVLTYRSPETR